MLNKATLIGNLGNDPEIKTLPSGDRVCNFSLATSETWKDKSTGEKKEKTEWHNIVVFNQSLVKIIQSYVKKGDKLYIEGQIETRKWMDQSGNNRYTTEIVMREYGSVLKMLSSPKQETHTPPSPAVDMPSSDLDDEIPF